MIVLKAAALALALSATSAAQETASGPSVGHPLAPLCDLICGGKWQPPTEPYPDEIRTTMTFAWDGETQTIKGASVRSGGIAGIIQVTNLTFAYDPATDTITQTRAPDPAHWSTTGGDLPAAVSGKVTLADSGFQTRFDSPSTAGEMMITAVRFETPDLWVERSEITGGGQSTLGAEIRYARTSE